MLEIYVARHGQDRDNERGILNGHRDEPLTALGESQALVVAQEITSMGLHFDAMYSSPLQRAFKTAQTISEVSVQPIPVKLNSLIERDFGVMSGVPINKVEEMCAPDIIKSETVIYFLNPEGAETFPNLISRAKECLADLKTRHNSGSILLVCHGDIGKMIYAAFYNLPWEQVLTDFHFGNSEILYLAEGCDLSKTRLFTAAQHNQ